MTEEKIFESEQISKIDPKIENKLLTTNALSNTYVNDLHIDDETWLNNNKYKLVTVNSLKDFGQNINVDDMILYNKYLCNVNLSESANIENDLYDTDLFNYKIKNHTLTLYYDNRKIVDVTDESININNNYSYTINRKFTEIIESYNVTDKYYGLIFDVYKMNNLFDIIININENDYETFTNVEIIQYIAILRNGTQQKTNILEKAVILKYVEVEINKIKRLYIIKYSNNNEFKFNSADFILGDNVSIPAGGKFIIELENVESKYYDDNSFNYNYNTETHKDEYTKI